MHVPSVEVLPRDEMVALRAVASVGQDKILDSVVRPATPRQEMVDLTSPVHSIAAIEACTVLELAETADQSGRKRDPLAAEEMRVQGGVLEVHARPPSDIVGPVHLYQRAQHRPQYHESIGHPREQANAIASVSAK